MRTFTIFVCPVCGWGAKFPDHVQGTRDMCDGGGHSKPHPITPMERIEVVEVAPTAKEKS